MLAAMQAMQ
jgi:hypothetical protein